MSGKQGKEKETIATLSARVKQIEKENKRLNLRVATLEGTNAKLSREIDVLRNQTEDLTYRSMQRNLIFAGIAESKNEDCKEVLLRFMENNMKLSKKSMKDVVCPNVDIAHRMGRYQQGKTRPIVASFTTLNSKEMVRAHAKHLADTSYWVSDQLPKEMRLRRLAQIPAMKEMREAHPDSKISLVKDKLMKDGKIIPNNFQKNPVKLVPNPSRVMGFDDLSHTEVHDQKKSLFQGHATNVKTLSSVQAALSALYQDDLCSSSTHIVYAYRVKDEASRIVVRGHSDDGEWGAAAALANLLEDAGAEHHFVAVSRKYGGVDLGQLRFSVVLEVGTAALQQLEEDDGSDGFESGQEEPAEE